MKRKRVFPSTRMAQFSGLEALEDRQLLSAAVSIATQANALEGSAAGSFAVTLDAVQATDTVVNLSFGGTAKAGVNYKPIANTVTIPAGSIEADVALTPLVDHKPTGDLSVIATVGTSPNYTVASGAGTATATIVDDEAKVQIVANAASVVQGSAATFTVSRSLASMDPSSPGLAASLTVYLSVSGTARAGTDYTRIPRTVIIPAHKTSVTISINSIREAIITNDSTVKITVGSSPEYSIVPGKGSATMTVKGSRPTVTVQVLAGSPAAPVASPTLLEDPTAAGHTLTLTFTASRPASPTPTGLVINLSTAGTATSGKQYFALPKTVTIPPGKTSVTLVLVARDDHADLGNQTIVVNVLGGLWCDPDATSHSLTISLIDWAGD